MVLHPAVFKRAQAEMDRVLGGGGGEQELEGKSGERGEEGKSGEGGRRLPDMGDRDALPYLEAVVLEVYRCVPFAGLLPWSILGG